jgi:RNA ligase (TIGR02306 family)
MTRKLATVETVAAIGPIPNADAIVRARVRGWDVVTLKDEFRVGDPVVYFEVDSMLDVSDPRFEFLVKHGVRTDPQTDRSGHVLRTVKLRGQRSQGLALPLHSFPEIDQSATPGTDVTDLLGIIKWDPPLPPELAGVARGSLPHWTPTTDEERVQNLGDIFAAGDLAQWVATEKLDGTSCTFYFDPSVEHVFSACSRGRDLLRTDDSTQYRLADELGMRALLEALSARHDGSRVAVQGEIYGFGLQGNRLKLRDQRFSVFNFLVDGNQIPRQGWPAEVLAMSVPVYTDLSFPSSLDQALTDVDSLRSLVNPQQRAEGVVWRTTDVNDVVMPDGRLLKGSFKVVSNGYLLKVGG